MNKLRHKKYALSVGSKLDTAGWLSVSCCYGNTLNFAACAGGTNSQYNINN